MVASVLVLVGCSSPQNPSGEPTDITIVDVIENVQWYPACATSPIDLGGRLFYPLPFGAPAVDESMYPLPARASALGSGGSAAADGESMNSRYFMTLSLTLPGVAPPGPGDDVGTVIIYSNGMARFESESGTVAWLTTEKQYYGYVC
jgi:hypothetical protein